MSKALYTFGMFVLVCAGILFVKCGLLWRDCILQPQQEILTDLGSTLKENILGSQSNKETVSPLLRQAEEFALIINPPKPVSLPKQRTVLQEDKPQEVRQITALAGKVNPRFSLIATSCYRSNPEKSVALIWEPGSGERWVGVGESLGHFVVESIKDGSIVYNDGRELKEIAVEVKPPLEIAKSRSNTDSTKIINTP